MVLRGAGKAMTTGMMTARITDGRSHSYFYFPYVYPPAPMS